MPHVTNDGLRLHYETEGAGPPVLFMHGYTSTIALWQDQVPVLSPHYRLIRMDLRGHGESDGTGMDGYNFAALAGDALAVLDQEGVERAVIVGHSMGGMVAQELLARHADRVGAAVFSSTTCKAPPREYFQPVVEWAVKLADIPAGELAADPLTRSCKPVAEATARGCGEMHIKMENFAESLDGCTTPCLVIRGSKESGTILSGSSALLDVLPNAREAVIEGAGHVPQITHPAAYNDVLAGFLRQMQ
ncbi:MAG: alpha/beta fold hydrolase [Gammaproteobacteria bacterium]|nr:alpha/beta fold hydrolase [Chromatiales bacterium]MYE49819.1 alpha/beta fold hydrolase [Gammaproteobacteria bacterium]MYI20814.1 alpha/beta fold hydrolase [Acidimicrobiia bacterium]